MFYEYKHKIYPSYLKDGNAISYIVPIASYFCKGNGLDIGGTKDWHFPGARHINIINDDKYHAMNIPKGKYDFIISSHTLEHLENPNKALKYWTKHIKKGGILYLYLPHYNMEYWTFDNPKHKHFFHSKHIVTELMLLGYKNIICSGQDMYWSFSVVGQKDKVEKPYNSKNEPPMGRKRADI